MKELDKIYIAQYLDKIGIAEITKSFYTYSKQQIENEIIKMKQSGTFNVYKNLSEDEWLILESKSDNYIKKKYENIAKYDAINTLIKEFNINFREIIKEFPIYMQSKETFNRDYFKKEDYEGEEWKQIGNSNYAISNYGRIKNTVTKKLKQLKYQKYGMQVILWHNSESQTVTISRLVAEMFIRHVEKNERVSHINNNIRDNYYKNLKIVSM